MMSAFESCGHTPGSVDASNWSIANVARSLCVMSGRSTTE